jgi:hypothetical protein
MTNTESWFSSWIKFERKNINVKAEFIALSGGMTVLKALTKKFFLEMPSLKKPFNYLLTTLVTGS